MIYIRFVRIIILYQNIPGILYIFNHQIYITYTRIYIYKYVTTFIYLKDKNRYIIFIYKLLYFTLLILSHGFLYPYWLMLHVLILRLLLLMLQD